MYDKYIFMKKQKRKSIITRLRRKIEKIFFAGLLVTIPTMLAFFLLRFLVNYIDKVSGPIVRRLFHTNVPGIGFSVTVLLVLTIGFIGTNILGKQLVSLGDRLLSKIPLVRSIYSSAKQVIETAMFASDKPFQQVVLVPYPREGVYAIGLVTREVSHELTANTLVPMSQNEEERKGDQIISVFIPSTPNFTSGLLVMFPGRDIIPLSMTIEEGFKYLMSGGILTPEKEPKGKELEEWELFLY
jgi:uncharacterized membrane protein